MSEALDSRISVGHPFYFPTQIVLVDDDPDFLEGVSLMLNKDLAYKLFQSASQALDYVNQAHLHVNFLQRCYTSYKTGPLASDALSHIDIGKLHLEVLNGQRFQTCSTVIVDYSMPEMNGLEFLMELKNPYIKKVLLTGQADMELAVKAFNRQLIDQFIDKHDPKMKLKLNTTIAAFQDQYFRSAFKLLTDPIIANNHEAFLVDAGFQRYFEEIRRKLNCVEYYMIDSPHAGFLLVDSAGERRCLLVYTEEARLSHLALLEELQAPAELRKRVRDKELLPAFDDQDETLAAGDARLNDWPSFYYPAMPIHSGKGYHVTIVSDLVLPRIHERPIIAYADFLQANCFINEIFH